MFWAFYTSQSLNWAFYIQCPVPFSQQPYNVGTIIITTLQIRQLRHREGRLLFCPRNWDESSGPPDFLRLCEWCPAPGWGNQDDSWCLSVQGCTCLMKRTFCPGFQKRSIESAICFPLVSPPQQLPSSFSPSVRGSLPFSCLRSRETQVSFGLADPFHPCGCRRAQKWTCLRILPDRRGWYPMCPNPKLKLWCKVQNAFRGNNLWKPQEIRPELPE